jgi:uncharacterized protein (TIGR00730 family)
MKRLAVFCGSNSGIDPDYTLACDTLSAWMLKHQVELVYGGGQVGLMGAIANRVLAGGGKVTGVIPEKLAQKEIAHLGVTELIVVSNMHERKAKMAELADAFLALPGGIGTLEEITEVFTWALLGYHQKPCALLNTNGFYEPLNVFLQSMVLQGFLKQSSKDYLLIGSDVEELMHKIMREQTPATLKI